VIQEGETESKGVPSVLAEINLPELLFEQPPSSVQAIKRKRTEGKIEYITYISCRRRSAGQSCCSSRRPP